MNLTITTNYHEATVDADEFAHETGIPHLVVELLPAGDRSAIASDLDEALLPDDMIAAPHRYTVLSEAEWTDLADRVDGEIQYEAEAAR